MYRYRIAWLAFTTEWLASQVYGQAVWQANQVNSTMCWWENLRVAVLRDTVYLDGGSLGWAPGLADGSYGSPVDDDNPLGLIYTYNFSIPFNASTNVSTIFNTISKGLNGGAANNIAPNYFDGALLANDDEFFLYGGLVIQNGPYSALAAPDADAVLAYIASQYGTSTSSFRPGFFNYKLPDGLTRYVTYGGTANAPSEKKAWYFGGYRSASWGPIYQPGANTSTDPSTVSDTLITLDMATQNQEVWENVTLPRGIPSRANPSMVWVPVGEQGILVVLGGVTYPEYDNSNRTSLNPAQSERDSPGFMQNIDIYDVASSTWYQQPTVGGPPALAMGCAVVATASDQSSYNIYFYGGYDGIHQYSDYNDDVWILSLPSFMWMKVTSGTAQHGRAGHHCVMPYPDQMLTIGGRTNPSSGATEPPCLEGDPPGILQVYNLTAAQWMDSYNPENWDQYGVPEMIHVMIGGDYSGGATMTAPNPSGWVTSDLASVFATPYPTSKLTSYYPYSSVGPGGSTRGDTQVSAKGTPSWIGPVLGVVLGLVFITAIVVGVLLYRRRKLLKKNTQADPSGNENGSRILSWMRETNDGKAPTVTTDDTRTQFDEMESRGVTPMRSPGHPEMAMVPLTEMPDTQLVELWDTSPKVELGDTNVSRPFTSHPQTPRSISTPIASTQAYFPIVGSSSQDHAFSHAPAAASSSSSSSSNTAQQQPPIISHAERPDSPPLGTNAANTAHSSINSRMNTPVPSNPTHNPSTSANAHGGIVSGISGISDRDRAHLRQISDATVSSEAESQTTVGVARSFTPPPPASQSQAATTTGSHYIVHPQDESGQRGTGVNSPLRRSVFRENEGDMGGEEQQ